MKQFWDDFKAFIMRGNVLDLAVAVVIGAAFKAVDRLVGERRDHADHRRHRRQAELQQPRR